MKKALHYIFTVSLFGLAALMIPCTAAAQDKKPAKLEETYNGEVVYRYGTIDSDPTFRGGDMREFHKWFRDRRDNKGESVPGITARLKFIVDTQGKVRNMRVSVPSAHEQKIVEKIVKKVPDWTPGTHRGKPVNTYIEFSHKYVGD